MITEEQIKTLETRISDIENKVDSTLEVLGQMNEKLKNIERGIYGDPTNKTLGLIERQEKDESKLRDLESRVSTIEKRQSDDVVKKDTITIILNKAIKVFGIIMMGWLVVKNVVGIDTLMELIFKK